MAKLPDYGRRNGDEADDSDTWDAGWRDFESAMQAHADAAAGTMLQPLVGDFSTTVEREPAPVSQPAPAPAVDEREAIRQRWADEREAAAVRRWSTPKQTERDALLRRWSQLAPPAPESSPFGTSPLARQLDEEGWFSQLEAQHAAEREEERQEAIRRSQEAAERYGGAGAELYPGQAGGTRRLTEGAREFGRGVTDIQQYAEVLRGFLPGLVSQTGTELRGIATLDPAEAIAADVHRSYMADLRRVPQMSALELQALRQRVARDPSPATRGAVQSAISDLVDGGMTVEGLERQFRPPVPITERPLFQRGTEISEFARTVVPAAPGYEQSVGRQLGEGLGSWANFLATAPLGLVVGMFRSGSMGAGEAADRAIQFDRAERAAGRPGLTQQQINDAARLGVVPGMTDILPVELLLARLRLPATPGFKAAAERFLSTGLQQFVIEGVQEGLVQQTLQNVITWHVYNPNQDITEDVLRSFGIGGGVGAIGGIGTEAARGLLGRRGARGGRPLAPDDPLVGTSVHPVTDEGIRVLPQAVTVIDVVQRQGERYAVVRQQDGQVAFWPANLLEPVATNAFGYGAVFKRRDAQ
jgi:hypothetical protein